MATVEVKTAKGNIARITVDMAKYKGKGKDALIRAEKGFWTCAYSGVSEEKVVDALGKLWDLTYPEKAESRKAEPKAE